MENSLNTVSAVAQVGAPGNEQVVNNYQGDDDFSRGAYVLLNAIVNASLNMFNAMQAEAADRAVKLANLEAERSQQANAEEQAYFTNQVEPNEGNPGLLQEKSTYLGQMNTENQAAIKSIDPSLTSAQNQPSTLAQSLNLFLNEAGSVLEADKFLAGLRIS